MNELSEHSKVDCLCGHEGSLHDDHVVMVGAHDRPTPRTLVGPHEIRCRRCDMDRDVFPQGFADSSEARHFLSERLKLPSDTSDYENAARSAYLQMPVMEQQRFEGVWDRFRRDRHI